MQNILSVISCLLIINVLLLMFSVNSNAQPLNLNSPLPINQTIKKGVLKNGMTYYIHKTDVTKGVASYYLIQNVGSVLEEDNQQGLAHVLEHMAFNGTENFKGKGLLNTLQKQGLVFGRDINAYTGFDETVYHINNLPTTAEGIDLGLLILHDWSNYLLLTEEEIDAERGVIKEEWRTRQNGEMRILQQSLSTLFNHSKYANRVPIGTMDVVENFKYQELRDFYQDWYRTDLQAIAVVGDIDIDTIEQKIKTILSPIPAVKHPRKHDIIHIPDNVTPLYHLAMDDEVTTSQITFGIRHSKSFKGDTVADLKKSLIYKMITSMLSTRIDELAYAPDAPFLGVRLGYGSHSRSTNSFSVTIFPKANQQQEAFETTLREINRAVKFGFTATEIERTIIQLENDYDTQISKKGDTPHATIIETIKQNYLEQIPMIDIEKEYELAKQIFELLDPSELQIAMAGLYTNKNRYISVTGVKGHKNLTKDDALKRIKAIEEDHTLTAYTDAFTGKTLLSGIPIDEGLIVSENTLQTIGSTTFTLSNGIKVHYKFVDKNKNDVQLHAISYGGLSLVKDHNLPVAKLLSQMISLSGLGDYSATDVSKVLAGKTAHTRIHLSDLTENISGTSTTKDVETLLQMIHLHFVNPRFDTDAYQVLMGNLDHDIMKRCHTINEKISDSVTATLYGNNHPKRPLFNDDFVKEVSFDKVKTLYKERFHNAADFEFFIVGDIQKRALRPLLETYIASIPTNDAKETWQDHSVPWLKDTIHKDIPLVMETPKSSVRIGYKNAMSYSLKNELIAKTLGDILQLRFTETLREEARGAYGASVKAGVSKRPIEEASLQIAFDGDPNKVEQLVTTVHREIEKIAKGDMEQTDLDKTKAHYLKERKQQQDYNSYDMNVLTNYFREGYNMNDPKNFEDLVNTITIKDLETFTKALIKNSKSYEIVFNPDRA